MKDFLGNTIEVGAKVVFIAPNYRQLVKGEIIKITPKKVLVRYINNWNFSTGTEFEVYQEPQQVVVNN